MSPVVKATSLLAAVLVLVVAFFAIVRWVAVADVQSPQGGSAAHTAVIPGAAFEGRLQPTDGGAVVIVWRDVKAQDEGLALIRAGVNTSDPSRLVPFISCVVPPGTKAVGISTTFFLNYDVKVLTGEHFGCRGSVRTEVFKKERVSAAGD
jgi:hypothetical protein